jgi:predicted nucleic acid-binding Zn ribbon protein
MKDEPVKTCPKCGGKVKRLIGSGAGPIFKGTGFYQTDYKNKSNSVKGDKKKSD